MMADPVAALLRMLEEGLDTTSQRCSTAKTRTDVTPMQRGWQTVFGTVGVCLVLWLVLLVIGWATQPKGRPQSARHSLSSRVTSTTWCKR